MTNKHQPESAGQKLADRLRVIRHKQVCQKLGLTRTKLIVNKDDRITLHTSLSERHSIILQANGIIKRQRIRTYGPKPSHSRLERTTPLIGACCSMPAIPIDPIKKATGPYINLPAALTDLEKPKRRKSPAIKIANKYMALSGPSLWAEPRKSWTKNIIEPVSANALIPRAIGAGNVSTF